MSLAGAVQNGSPVYLYLPIDMQMLLNVIFVYFRLWYPELASFNDRWYVFFSFGNSSLTVGSLFTGLINTCLSLPRTNCRGTVPSGLDTRAKLLHQSDALSTPSGTIIAVVAAISILSWIALESVHAMH